MHSNSYQTIVAGVMLVRNQEGKYLFMKRSSVEHYGAGLWDFPGGAKEFLESTEGGAVRECKEESGIAIEQPELVWHFVAPGHDEPTLEFVCFVYLGLVDNPTVQLSSEHDEYLWMTMEEAKEQLTTVHWIQDFFNALEEGRIKL